MIIFFSKQTKSTMYFPMGCCLLNLSPLKCFALKCLHIRRSVSVARFLRFSAKGVNFSAIYWFTLTLTLSHQGRGIKYPYIYLYLYHSTPLPPDSSTPRTLLKIFHSNVIITFNDSPASAVNLKASAVFSMGNL